MCSRPRRAITRSMTDCEMDSLCMGTPPGLTADYAGGRRLQGNAAAAFIPTRN